MVGKFEGIDMPKPIPTVTEDSKPYWEGCKKHELLIQRCKDCGHYRFPPSGLCPKCMSTNTEWTRVSGRGKVYSWTIFHYLYHPAFSQDIPYNVAIVELEEGPRMHTNIVGCSNEDIYIDMPVEVVFEDISEEIALPKFKPREKQQ
jgi:hypothetical protein